MPLIQVQDHTVVRWLKRVMPMTDTYEGRRFTVIKNGVRMATPLTGRLVGHRIH
jgi:hypothetical protein